MAQSILLNRAKMTVSGNPGTGAVTLNAAVPGYQTFAAAGAVDQMFVSYVIEQGTIWEIGQGTYTASGTSLARTTIIASSSGGAAVSFNSTALVYIDALANNLTPAYEVDGLPAAAVFSAPKQAFYLNGASVAPTALLTWSSAQKYTVAQNGNYQLISANQPAWDWSSGYERLLIEAVGSTNYAPNSEAPTSAMVGANFTISNSANSLFGIMNRCTLTATTANGSPYYVGSNLPVTSGQIASLTVALNNGTGSWVGYGIYGSSSGWGANTDTVCHVISGPGTVTQSVGGLWVISGATSDTVIRWTRTFHTSENVWFFGYTNCAVGQTVSFGIPQLELGYGSSYIPCGASPTARAADVVTASSGLLALLTAANATLAWRGTTLTTGSSFIASAVANRQLYDMSGGTIASFYTGTQLYTSQGAGSTAYHWGIAAAYGQTRKLDVNGGLLVSDTNGFLSSADTSVTIGACAPASVYGNLYLDELVVWPFYGSDAGVQAQARVYS